MAAVRSFTLVDAATDRDIVTLTDGATLAALPSQQFSVRANVSGRVRSVRFGLDGDAAYRTDNTDRYALAGNRRGNYFPWTPQAGAHALVATPYPRLHARGRAGTALEVTFTVMNQPAAVSTAPVSTAAALDVAQGSDVADGEGGGDAVATPPEDAVATPPEVTFSGPLIITRGGVYSGYWESLNPAVPAVSIRTDEPVVIEHSVVRGRGQLIETDGDHADVTVRNTSGYALNPDVHGMLPGRFFDSHDFDNIVLENNHLEGTGGIKLLGYAGDFSAANSVRIVGNSALNIDGRKSDGNGGFLDFDQRTRLSDGLQEKGYKPRQFVQLDKVAGVPGVEIAWNQVVNQPGNSRVEDNINIFKSSGTADSPIRIHNNYIQGAYTSKPWQASYSDGTWYYDWRYSGGGILLGDGRSGAEYLHAYDNHVVSTTNHGIAIAAGHDSSIYDNRVVSSGLLADGRRIAAQNVGVYIWDLYAVGPAGFYNNSASNNLVGWVDKNGRRNDWWNRSASSFDNNIRWEGALTPEVEAAEFTYWLDKLAAAGVTIGPIR